MDQKTAFKMMRAGESIFLTGSAGTGKTFILNEYILFLKSRNVNIAVVSSTGIAASHLKGSTIHSFFGLGIKEVLNEKDLNTIINNNAIQKKIENLSVLIIDEVSMVSPALFDTMDLVIRSIKGSDDPFGGIQVIVTGDFFQLPPVSKGRVEKKFAWQSKSWKELDLKTAYLQKKFRQTQGDLVKVLDAIRAGDVTKEIMDILDKRVNINFPEGVIPTRLYTHNLDVDAINQRELNALKEKEYLFRSYTQGKERAIEKFFRNSLLSEELKLKKGALVMFLKNDPKNNVVNGTTGIVVDFKDGYPVVKTQDGNTLKVTRETWEVENDKGNAEATIEQIPLKLAWAITIHKSQGLTLDYAEIDLTKTFVPGQGYVALSRLRDIDGLKLVGYNAKSLEVDPLMLYVDNFIKKASQKCEKEFSGLLDEVKDLFQPKPKEKTTVEITKEFLESGESIKSVAQKRGIKEGTVIAHLEKIIKEYPDFDIAKFRPKSTLVRKVARTMDHLEEKNDPEVFTEKGELKLSAILREVKDKSVGYDDIKLALLFID